MSELVFTAGEGEAGERLDRFLARKTGLARGAVADLIDGGSVTVEGKPVTRRSLRLSKGEVVRVRDLPVSDEETLQPDASVPFGVLYEDEHVVVVDKPAGVVVHPGSGVRERTLVSGLLARYPELREVGDPARPGIVHRLDKGTSGAMVVARSQVAYQRLVEDMARRRVRRVYVTLVEGNLAEPIGTIEAPIGRSRRDRTKMTVTAAGRPAISEFRRLERFKGADLVEVSLITGRTHQIRVHFSAIGHPVVGDTTYAKSTRAIDFGLQRPFLHAHSVTFEHPVSGENLVFVSPLPADLEAALEIARRQARGEKSSR